MIVHGVSDTPVKAAESYLKEWVPLANQFGMVLVAPIFNDEDFCSKKTSTSNWGYRGLLGRQIHADEYLHEIIAQLEQINPDYDGRFILFGHSAGGQFANRYLVAHPERVVMAVISAPSWYAFPNDSVIWPNGMKRRKREEKWADGTTRSVDVQPTDDNFSAATQIPTLVIVGDQDLKELDRGQFQEGGNNRIQRAQLWVKSMGSYAKDRGTESKISFTAMPGVGHSPRDSLRFSSNFVARFLQSRESPAGRKTRRAKR